MGSSLNRQKAAGPMASHRFFRYALSRIAWPALGSRRSVWSFSAAPMLACGALGLMILAPSNRAQAATVVQNFTYTDLLNSFTASSSQVSYYAPLTLFTVQPFDASLGTFISGETVWSTSAAFTGTIGAEGGGSAAYNFVGATYLDGNLYDSYGDGGGSGGGPGSTFSVATGPVSRTDLFLAANAGDSEDPAFVAAFTGASQFSISYSGSYAELSPYRFNYTNILSGSSAITTTAVVTYEYAPAPASVPGPLPLLGAGAAWKWSRHLRRRCAQRQG